MNRYKYDVSLRIRHPEIDPEVICKKLRMKARHKWMSGSQRKTSKGVILDGVYEYSYCSFRLEHSKNLDLIEFLRECNERFYPHKEFFKHIRSSGGTIEYFIGWYFNGNSGEVFDLNLLSQMTELNIDLSLDIYGENK